MKNYASYSFWLETCGDDLTPRPPLDGSIDVDIAILGAGYSGLWTAYYLLKHNPNYKIAVIEREIAGFGASGRNGGWVSSGFPVTLGELERRYGFERSKALLMAMYESVDEVGRVCAEEGIEAFYRNGGVLRLARGKHQLPGVEGSLKTYERYGVAENFQLLSAQQVAERVRVTNVVGGMFGKQCAVVHPGRLARGLARVVEHRGATIYERTPVIDFETGAQPKLITNRGEVRAATIVLAGEAYLTQLPKLNRKLIPIYSLIVLSEPLSEEQWAQIGWQNHECLSSNRYTVDYLSRTMDGRIVFGGRGAPYQLGSRIGDDLDRHAPTHHRLRQQTLDWFPALAKSRFTHAWGGPLGMPRDWMPTMSYDRASGVATARGYTGQGVSTTNLSGRILADLIHGVESPITKLPPVGHHNPDWEPEPLRWLGIRFVQEGYGRLDRQAERTGIPPSGATLVERLGSH